MAEEKPKGDPVFLTIAGKKVTLPGVTSLNTDDELSAAANDWIAKNYEGPEIGAPVVFRTPKMDEKGGFAPGEEIIVQAPVARPFEQPLLGAAAEAANQVIGEQLGFDPSTMAALSPDQSIISQFNRNLLQTAQPLAQALEAASAAPTAALSGLAQLAYNLGITNEDPRRTAAAAEEFINIGLLPLGTMTGPNVPTARQLLRETPLSPQMKAVAEPIPPAPIAPTTLRRAQAVDTPEAPALTAEIPEAPVVPTPAVKPPEPAITPERLAEIRTNAETVLNDMAAGAPEAPIPERIGALKATNLTTPDDTKRFLADVAKANKDFPEARRGTMTIEQINELSKDVDLNQILGRKIGVPLNAEQIQAAKSVVYQTADDAIAKAKAWVASGGQDATAFQEAMDSVASNTALFETLQGASSELGRAMRVLREQPSVEMSLAMKQLMEQRAGGVPIEEIMQRLATFDDPKKASQFIGKMSTPDFKDKVEEYYVNALLSGQHTQSLNLTSNLITTLLVPVEKGLAAGIGAVRRTPDRITLREVGKRVAGMAQGTRDGLRIAKEVMITGDTPGDRTNLERQRKAISGVKGEIVRLPSRFLAAQDELFKSIHRRGELAAQAYDKASKESAGDTAKFNELYANYLNNPTPEAVKAAEREALYRTFQSDLGRFGKWLQSGAGKFFAIRFLQPFIRTPFNLISYAAERSPLSFSARRWREEIKAGGRQRDDALAKLTLGLGITGTTAAMALNGMITGSGPSDPEERAALMATGWQPYSFKFNDTYYPYGRIDPTGTTIGVVADLVTMRDYMTEEEYGKVASLIPFAVAANLAEKTYLQGMSNLFEAFYSDTAPLEKIQKYLENTAAGFYPNIMRQTANALDPQLREASGFLEEIKNRTPIVRGNTFRIAGTDYDITRVPARVDVWGEPIYRSGFIKPEDQSPSVKSFAVVYNAAFPVRASETVKDPVKQEVARLQLGLERPDKKISVSVNAGQEEPLKFSVELTDQERRQFTFASGKFAKALVEADMKTPEWKKMNDDERREQIRDRMALARKTFRSAFGVRALSRYVKENKKLPPAQP